MGTRRHWLGICALAGLLAACDYVAMLRPQTLKQLDPDVVRLVDELPELDHPNKEVVARLFAHGGLAHARLDADGLMHGAIRVPANEYIWKPAIIVMPRGGDLELDFSNEDQAHHMVLAPNDGGPQVLDLPVHSRGLVKVHLSQPGMYWFGCPVANHAGRGMLGFILVRGEVPADARLDRPRQRKPGEKE